MQLSSLIGTKSFQKQGFLQNGKRVPLTGIIVSGNVITQVKTTDKEGYNAIQLGFGTNKKAGKREIGQAKKAGLEKAPRFFKEIKTEDLEGSALGTVLNPSEVFAPGDVVDVTGTSKGKGWAGGVKRYGFHGGPRTHGQSDRERAPGSIGQTTTPGRVYKGKKMAGRMGTDTVTVKNLEVIEITNDGVLLIKGLVPRALNSLVFIKKVGENKKFEPLYKEQAEEPAQEAQATHEPTQEPETKAAEDNQQESQSAEEASTGEEAQTEAQKEPITAQDQPAAPVQEVNSDTKEVKEGEENATS